MGQPSVVGPQQAPVANAGLRRDPEMRYPVEFSATAGEYFRIWIVNLVLTVLTLGIYSAWAKVRKRRYFYANTRIDGDGLEYRAKPTAILKGRLIAVGLLALATAAAVVSPLWGLAFLVGGAALFPWLFVRSLAFNARNTAYRNVTLHFRGRYGACLRLMLGYALIVVVTLGIALIAYPYFKRRLIQFAAENHYFGTTQFSIAEFKKAFIKAYSHAIGLGILLGIPCALVAGAARVSGDPLYELLGSIPGYVAYFVILGYLRARTLNAVWNNLAVGGVRFESTLRARDMIRIYLVNIVAVIVTLGFATPWAKVRTLRYRAEHTSVVAAGGLDRFVAAESAQVSAAGEEVGEMFDVDIAL
jgi:uncharacterized membrane protein YjgN (DUF898 family)